MDNHEVWAVEGGWQVEVSRSSQRPPMEHGKAQLRGNVLGVGGEKQRGVDVLAGVLRGEQLG